MMYSGVLLKLDLPREELAEKLNEVLGPKLGLRFHAGYGKEPWYAFRHRRRFELRDTSWSDDPEWAMYPVEICIDGSADRARLRNARDVFEALRVLGVPMALVDMDVSIVDRWQPQATEGTETSTGSRGVAAPDAAG